MTLSSVHVSCSAQRNAKAPLTRCNLLSNRFDNQLNVCIHVTTGCQTSLTTGCIVYTAGYQTDCTTRFDNWLNEQWLFVQHGCQTGLTTGWMFVYTIQPVVKPAVSCKRGITDALLQMIAY